MSDKIELNGIFEDGYGIIPKKLMRMKFGDIKIKTEKKEITVKGVNIKAVLAYMLSYTGAGKTECFPSIKTIADDLEISRDTVTYAVRAADEILNLINKEKMYPDDPLKHNNKYTLKFLNIGGVDVVSQENRLTVSDGSTFVIRTLDKNNNSINNNKINNSGESKFHQHIIDVFYKEYKRRYKAKLVFNKKEVGCVTNIRKSFEENFPSVAQQEFDNRFKLFCDKLDNTEYGFYSNVKLVPSIFVSIINDLVDGTAESEKERFERIKKERKK